MLVVSPQILSMEALPRTLIPLRRLEGCLTPYFIPQIYLKSMALSWKHQLQWWFFPPSCEHASGIDKSNLLWLRLGLSYPQSENPGSLAWSSGKLYWLRFNWIVGNCWDIFPEPSCGMLSWLIRCWCHFNGEAYLKAKIMQNWFFKSHQQYGMYPSKWVVYLTTKSVGVWTFGPCREMQIDCQLFLKPTTLVNKRKNWLVSLVRTSKNCGKVRKKRCLLLAKWLFHKDSNHSTIQIAHYIIPRNLQAIVQQATLQSTTKQQKAFGSKHDLLLEKKTSARFPEVQLIYHMYMYIYICT